MKMIMTWMGKPVTDLPRETLLEVIEHCGEEIRHLQAECNRMRPHVDWRGYLSAPRQPPPAAFQALS